MGGLRSLLAASATVLMAAHVIHADDNTPLKQEWLELDLKLAENIARQLRLERQTFHGLRALFQVKDYDDFGFGGRHFNGGRGGGYTSFNVRGFTFNGQLGFARIGFAGSWEERPQIRDQVLKVWRGNGGPALTCEIHSCWFEIGNPEVIQAYKDEVAQHLGPQREVTVPAALRDAYATLMSLDGALYIGPGICGLGGSVLSGKQALDALYGQRRSDLLVNVLRGYNPGGRVYALIGLDQLRRNGHVLSQQVLTTMEKVRNLDIPLSTCWGCIVNQGLTARDAIERFHQGGDAPAFVAPRTRR